MSLESFFDDADSSDPYSQKVCDETRRRIRVSIAAYAYEILLESIMTDHEYDELAKSIDLSIDTRRPDLDKWFRANYKDYTGSWIHNHPDRHRLNTITQNVVRAYHERRRQV